MEGLLSAASLLLAAIAILYGLWYPEICKALDTPNYPVPGDKKSEYKKFKSVFRTKAIPLFVTALALTLVFLPDATRIVMATYDSYSWRDGSPEFDYDAISTSFVFVVLLSGVLTVHLFKLAVDFKAWLRTNNPDRNR